MTIYFIGTDIHAPLISMESRLVAQLSQLLQKSDIDHSLISIQFSKPAPPQERTFYVRGIRSGPLLLQKATFALTLVHQLWKKLRRNQAPAICHFIWVGAPILLPTLFWLCRTYNTKVVVTLLNSSISSSRYRKADWVIVQSNSHKRKVIEQLGPGSSVSIIPPSTGTDKQCKAANLKVEDYFLVASGPFSEKQIGELGVPVLFKAFAILAREGSPIELQYVTRWPDGVKKLQELADKLEAGNVSFITGIRSDIGDLMCASRGVIVPFVSGADVPMSAIEALANGVPVIASDSLGIAEDIVANQAGGQFRCGDAESLAHAIKEVYHAGSLPRLNAKAMSEKYELEYFETSYKNIYATLASAKSNN